MRMRKALAAEVPLKTVLRDHRGAVLLSILLTWLLSGFIVIIILMTPSLLQKTQAVPLTMALKTNSIATFCLAIGCIAGGALIDGIAAGRFFALGSVLLGVSTWLFYTESATEPSLLFPLLR